MTYQELLALIRPENQYFMAGQSDQSGTSDSDQSRTGARQAVAGTYSVDPNDPMRGYVTDLGNGSLVYGAPRASGASGGQGVDEFTYDGSGRLVNQRYNLNTNDWKQQLATAVAVLGGAALGAGAIGAAGAGTGATVAGTGAATAGTAGVAGTAGGAAAAGGAASLLTPTNVLLAGSMLTSAVQARQQSSAIRDSTAANERIAAEQATAAEQARLDAERARQAAIAAGGSQPGRSPDATSGARARNRAGAGSTMLTGAGGVSSASLALGAPTLLGRLA